MFWLASARLQRGAVSNSRWGRGIHFLSKTGGCATAPAFSPTTHRLGSGRLSQVPGSRCHVSQNTTNRPATKSFHSQSTMEQRTGHPRLTPNTQRPVIRWHIAAAFAVSSLAYYAAAARTNSTTCETEQLQVEPTLIDVVSRREHKQYLTLWSDVRKVAELQLDMKLDRIGQSILAVLSSAPQGLQDACAFVMRQYRDPPFLGSDGWRAAMLITGVNIAVWLAWKVPRLQPFMRTHFRHDPLSGKVYTMLTSVFSHETLLNLGGTTILLAAGTSHVVSVWMDQEQQQPGHLNEGRSIYHFLAFFVSASMFSSLFSHVFAARILYPRMMKQLAQDAPKPSTSLLPRMGTPAPPSLTRISIPPSSGSSGAVFAGFTIFALSFPDVPISLNYLPAPNIPLAYGMGGFILFDCIGALRGWR
ncbi:hypothetical protein DENSPDRAFT_845985 [Dentipellis sp. KUC8613]|nr:hypothetical protein DENSPDRAFT_845985 [Dentipellis sp. KUC8613]